MEPLTAAELDAVRAVATTGNTDHARTHLDVLLQRDLVEILPDGAARVTGYGREVLTRHPPAPGHASRCQS